MDDLVLVEVNCNNCGEPFMRRVGKKYISENGKVTHGVYCNYCRRVKEGIRRGRTMEYLAEVHTEIMAARSNLKIYSPEEIAEFERRHNA